MMCNATSDYPRMPEGKKYEVSHLSENPANQGRIPRNPEREPSTPSGPWPLPIKDHRRWPRVRGERAPNGMTRREDICRNAFLVNLLVKDIVQVQRFEPFGQLAC